MAKSIKCLRGVTLVEIAIVLVIIGLLLGGVLKGQELINNAKVRSIADRQNSLKVAWFAFIDRYQALPGDYVYAQQYISGAANGAGDGFLTIDESPMVFQHLTGSGYLRCPQCTSSNSILPSAYNSLQNSYGGIMAIFHDSSYYATLGGPENAGSARLQVHTGGRIPSNIIGEVDRKLDDGVANRGDFVFNDYESTSFTPGVADCTTKSQSAQSGGTLDESVTLWWRHATASPPVEPNCGGSVAI